MNQPGVLPVNFGARYNELSECRNLKKFNIGSAVFLNHWFCTSGI